MSSTMKDAATITSWCVSYVSRILNIPEAKVDPSVPLERFGLDSATAVALIMDLEQWLDVELKPELLFEYPTLASLSAHLASLLAADKAEAA
jgi:acyl carrier protein